MLGSRGLHGATQTLGPKTHTGSDSCFMQSVESRSGPILLLKVPGLFNIMCRNQTALIMMEVLCVFMYATARNASKLQSASVAQELKGQRAEVRLVPESTDSKLAMLTFAAMAMNKQSLL